MGESRAGGGRGKRDVTFEADEPFGVVGCCLVPGVVVVVDDPAGLVLDFGVGGDLEISH